MSTSGVYRSLVDMEVECDQCDWTGWVEAVDDSEDLTTSWTCPGCAHPHQLIKTDRGGIAPFLSLLVLGALMVAAPLISLLFIPGTLAHQLLILTGALLLAGLGTAATLTWLHQKGIS